MNNHLRLTIPLALALSLAGCAKSGAESDHGDHDHAADTHTHADGSTHEDHGHDDAMEEHDGMHESIPLKPATIAGMSIELTQGHGAVGAGEEEHLIVMIDGGETDIMGVRAWIGTEDRTMSYVGKGEYSVIGDSYDIHAIAPDPLPENAMWWIEIELADGTKQVGSTELVR